MLPCGSNRVLAVDPSLRSTGYAVLEKADPGKIRALAYGNIRNANSLRVSSCLVCIHDRLAELIQKFEPNCAALEAVIYVQSHRTAITMGAARGAALIAMAERGIATHEYAPRRVKQAIVGRGGAQKHQVAFMVRALLELTETPESDAADALAIGITHLQCKLSGSAVSRQI